MEKIQSAIAKARAARGEALPEIGEPTAPSPIAVPDSPPGSDSGASARPQALAEAPVTGASATADVPEAAPDGEAAAREAAVETLWEALPFLKVRPRHLARHRIITPGGGRGTAEFDMIRTRLLHQMRSEGWRRVAIVSPTPRCGKTMVTANLAFGLGRQRDQRILVAELDFRHPTLAQVLGVAEQHRFSRVLEGEARLADHALRHGRNLALATDRGGVRNPADLLQSERAAKSLAAIEATYAPTVMLFDLPPLLVNDDAMAAMGLVDCALIVAAAETTTIKEIDTCERAVASRTNVLGVVLNKCRYMKTADRYGDYV